VPPMEVEYNLVPRTSDNETPVKPAEARLTFGKRFHLSVRRLPRNFTESLSRGAPARWIALRRTAWSITITVAYSLVLRLVTDFFWVNLWGLLGIVLLAGFALWKLSRRLQRAKNLERGRAVVALLALAVATFLYVLAWEELVLLILTPWGLAAGVVFVALWYGAWATRSRWLRYPLFLLAGLTSLILGSIFFIGLNI